MNKNLVNKTIKPGFSLLEIMIALLIAGIIGTSLYQMVTKTQKITQTLASIMNLDSPIMPLYSQLEKDITGMFVPQSSQEALKKQSNNKQEEEKKSEEETKEKSQEEQKKEAEQKKKSQADNKKASNSEQEQKQGQENQKQEDIKAIENVFVINTTPNFSISFLTTGGLQEFNIEQNKINIKPEPYMRRASYIFKKDGNTGLYKLYYNSNAQNLELKENLNTKNAYIIANNIKEFKFNYTILDTTQNKLVEIPNWDPETAKQYKSLIPAYITANITFIEQDEELPLEFKFKVLTATEPKKNAENKK